MSNQQMRKEKIKWRVLFGCMAVLAFVLDFFTKEVALDALKDKAAYELIPGVLEFQFFANRGIAWSMLEGQSVIILLVGVVFLTVMLWFMKKLPTDKKFHITYILCGFLLGGALGNMMDRVFRGYVVDFIYVSLINFPIFNVADCFIVVSVFALAFVFLFIYKDEDLEWMNFGFR